MKIARTFLALAALSLGISAYAQDQQSWDVNVPFAFTMGHSYMEAGRYTVRQHSPFLIQLSNNEKTAILATVPASNQTPSTKSSLVFQQVDGEYILTRVTDQGSNVEFDARRKHAPKQLEASMGSKLVVETAIGTR
jgi:hypothetical protein